MTDQTSEPAKGATQAAEGIAHDTKAVIPGSK
jgi:hypothetical protein